MWFKKKKKPVEALAQQELTAPILEEPLPVLPEEPAELPEVALEDILNEFGGESIAEEAMEEAMGSLQQKRLPKRRL